MQWVAMRAKIATRLSPGIRLCTWFPHGRVTWLGLQGATSVLKGAFVHSLWHTSEWVTGRKARGLQKEEIGYKCQTFFISLLSGRRKETSVIFSLSLYKFKKRILLKFCYHNDTWFHLNLTFIKPWANQCIILMEMFVLSYINVLWIYCLKAQNQLDKPVVILIHRSPNLC